MGAEADVLFKIREYMEIYYLSIPFLVLPIVGNSAVAAVGNAILDPLLIFGYWGFPELGIRGAAWATLLAWMFATFVAIGVLYKREKLLRFNIPKFSDVLQSWKEVLSIGIPASAAYSLGPIAVALLVTLVASFGKEAVAAYGVVSRIRSVAVIIVLALSSALPVFVGQNWGAKEFGRVKESIRLSQHFVVYSQIVIAIGLYLCAEPIARVFSEEQQVIDLIKLLLYILPISFIGIGWSILASSAFNAINMPLKSMILNTIRFMGLYFPLAWVGSKLYGLNGLFIGMAVANVIGGIIGFFWIRNNCFHKEKDVEADTALSAS